MAHTDSVQRRDAIEDCAALLDDLQIKYDALGLVAVIRYIESGD